MDAYDKILEALDSVPWSRAPEVTEIRPVGHAKLNFFPGQRGFAGPEFPINGVMLVANNFDCLAGWESYRRDLNFDNVSRTWKVLTECVIPSCAPLRLEDFWFTNYCLGVLDKRGGDGQPSNTYRFPKLLRERLEFGRVFDECVAAMRPRLIATLGSITAECLGTDYKNRVRIDERVIGGHRTRLIALVHPSAWSWRGRGFSEADFRGEGERIRAALLT